MRSVITLFAALSALATSAIAAPATPCYDTDWSRMSNVRGTVVRSVDGDTARILIGQNEYSVRFQFIDTPETQYMGKSQGIWGDRAHEHLDRLLPPRTVVLLKFSKGERCDKYGRLLATVFRGNVNINLQMAADGFAVNYCIWPNDCPEYVRYVHYNVINRRGMFNGSVMLPYDWRVQVSNRQHEKYVGNMQTKHVFRPENARKVPIAYRVFFMTPEEIRAPYRQVE